MSQTSLPFSLCLAMLRLSQELAEVTVQLQEASLKLGHLQNDTKSLLRREASHKR